LEEVPFNQGKKAIMKMSFSIVRRGTFGLAMVLLASTSGINAQPGSLDTNFNAAFTTGGWGFSVAPQPDGKVIAAGTFGVVRLLADGSVDPGFQTIPPTLFTGAGNPVSAVALQPDGKVVVTGNFTNAAGAPLPGVMRLNADGAIDPSFSLDLRVYPGGRVLALQFDGKVVTDGFYVRGGEDQGSLVRLLSDGSLDPDWDARWYNDSGNVYSLTVADGKIYFGTLSMLARVNADGSRDDSFNADAGPGPIGAIAVQRDGKVLVGHYGDGPGYHQVRRLLPNGTGDPEWTPPDIDGGDAVVYAILLQPDGKVLVGGNNLQAFNGVWSASLARLNADGSVDTTFATQPDLHYYSVEDMALGMDGKVIVAGYQLSVGDYSASPGIWRLNNDVGPRSIEFTAAAYVVREDEGWADITVRRSGPAENRATVRYDVEPGSAEFGRDYIGMGGVLLFEPGQRLKSFRIRVKADHRREGPETVQLFLVRAIGSEIGAQDFATLTILDP
jgi:uncharacterized delta-60 repeat protein